MVKISPSNAGVQVQSLVRELIPHALWSKDQNIKQKQYWNKFNKALKMVHIKKRKKNLKKKKKKSLAGTPISTSRSIVK